VLLTFALTTELFATNSPSVLYSQAVDKIRASDAVSLAFCFLNIQTDRQLDAHLLPPLKFTHSPHSSAPVRGSPPLQHVNAKHPISGRDHMLVTFWVHGRGRDEPEPLGWIKGIWHDVEENLRWVGGYMGVSEPYEPGQSAQETVVPVKEEASPSTTGGGWFSGLSNSLRGTLPTRAGESRRGLPPAGTYKIGEVKAEYVKVGSNKSSYCIKVDE